MKKFKISGIETTGLTPDPTETISYEREITFSKFRDSTQMIDLDLEDNQVVEVIFESEGQDKIWLLTASEVPEFFNLNTISRSGEEIRVEINPNIEVEESVSRGGIFKKLVAKIIRVFAKKAITVSVKELAKRVDEKLEQGPGLFAVEGDFQLRRISKIAESTRPYFLFLHGTASSTKQSFGHITQSLDGLIWKEIQAKYPGQILAFEHETLTKSPLENVVDFMKFLPADQLISLHIMSQSRGGMIGDLLAILDRRSQNMSFFELSKDAYDNLGRTEDKKLIEEIETLCKTVHVQVDKFVRVACPAYGSMLASKRLNIYINVIFNLLARAIPVAMPFMMALKELLVAVVEQKDNEDALPGMEVQNPESPFIQILNNPSILVNTPLTVVSGNATLRNTDSFIAFIVARLFFLQKSDLIVQTESERQGAIRAMPIQLLIDEHGEVDHFHYFSNSSSVQAITNAIKTDTGPITGFVTYSMQSQEILQRSRGIEHGQLLLIPKEYTKPVIFLLPGIMGSTIYDEDDKIWLNYGRIVTGDLKKLKNLDKMESKSVIRTSYEEFCDEFKPDFDIYTFHFDWRNPIKAAAERFNKLIESEISKIDHPIKIVAHSMGGLVIRYFATNYPATWKKLNDLPGFKCLLLGTPWNGSYAIAHVFSGQSSIIKSLATLDVTVSKRTLLEMFTTFPGILQLLPTDKTDHDFTSPTVWADFSNAVATNWPIPSNESIQENIVGYQNSLKVDPAHPIDFSNVIYIAGKSDETVKSYRIKDTWLGNKIRFEATTMGDGSVTWESGIPPEVRKLQAVYYVLTEHGKLCADDKILNGYRDLLLNGTTTIFSKTPLVAREAETVFEIEDIPISTNDLQDLENNILQIDNEKVVQEIERPNLMVDVCNGDLFHASYPLLVGHFNNDGFMGAEKVVDTYLNGALSLRYKTGIYPKKVGSNEVLLFEDQNPKGAIIIGMDEIGTLTIFNLAKSVELGVLNYAIQEHERMTPGNEKKTLGMSTLLVGSGYGGLSIESSARAILQGVQNANAKMISQTNGICLPIDRVEFIELYEDRAIQCFYLINKLASDSFVNFKIQLGEPRIRKLSGVRSRMLVDQQADWWQRVTVTRVTETDGRSAIKYSANTGSAREELRTVLSQNVFIESLLNSMSKSAQWKPELAKSIFEILIPNDFKDSIRNQQKVLWVLDEYTAMYPWELLHDTTDYSVPLAVNAGMIRQLATGNFETKIRPALTESALVIGEPNVGATLSSLPGAKKEALLVADLLKVNGFNVTTSINQESGQIIQSLFSGEYKMIHLAGHGIYQKGNPIESGMIIGPGVYLTSAEIHQLSATPDIVFINCCYLGTVNSEDEHLTQDRYKLAASLGVELIQKGVKVVIAAGWAVDDEAALAFANKFYEEMFAGENFGDAVRAARQVCFDRFKHTNTWGAYQCYGDYSYKIRDKQKQQSSAKSPYFMSREAEIDIDNVFKKAQTGWYSNTHLLEELQNISIRIENAGLVEAALIESEANAYYELGQYEIARSKMQKILKLEDANFSVALLQNYCHLRVKNSIEQFKVHPDQPEVFAAQIQEVIHDLESLTKWGSRNEWNLLIGSAYKRLAIIYAHPSDILLKYLLQSYEKYFIISEWDNEENNQENPYALCNYAIIQYFIQKIEPKNTTVKSSKKELAIMKQKIQDSIQSMEDKTKKTSSYWKSIEQANLILTQILWEDADKLDDALFDKYKLFIQNAWRESGSKRKKKTQAELVEFILTLARSINDQSAIDKFMRILQL
ncbi:MAG: CHAT domain-containing protein [Saprospiraceae bacterium]